MEKPFTGSYGISRFRPSFMIICCLSFIIGMMMGCKGKSPEQLQSPSDTRSIQDRIRFKELNGDNIDLNALKGKTIFINFWATWCGPCIREMPSIERAKMILAEEPIEFLIASNEAVEQIESFTGKRNYALHYVQAQNLEELGIPALPTTYIINAAGELVFSETGFRAWDEPANIELLKKIINDHK